MIGGWRGAVVGGLIGLVVYLVRRVGKLRQEGTVLRAALRDADWADRVEARLALIEARLRLPVHAGSLPQAGEQTGAQNSASAVDGGGLPHDGMLSGARTEPHPVGEPPGAAQAAMQSEVAQARAIVTPADSAEAVPGAVRPALEVPANGATEAGWLERLGATNAVAKLGVIILFFGVGFLLKYAYDHAVLSPLARAAGLAFLAICLFAVGVRLLRARRSYALVLMGGAIGLGYLDVYFGLRLYGLIGPGTALFLFALLGVATVLLALRLDSEALAALGLTGAFAAPFLAAGEGGDARVLFVTYTLINLLVLLLAWLRAWRWVSLLGCLATFLAASAWGLWRYHPDDFLWAQSCLLVNFLIYVALPVCSFWRHGAQHSRIEPIVVFGTPTAWIMLQAGLVNPFGDYALALSAAGATILYAVLAWAERRMPQPTGGQSEAQFVTSAGLAASHAALAVVFFSLAIYFSFAPYPTVALWALEGAALVWVALRQRRLLLLGFGFLMQLLAAVYFLATGGGDDSIQPLILGWSRAFEAASLGRFVLACGLLALAAGLSAWFVFRHVNNARPHTGKAHASGDAEHVVERQERQEPQHVSAADALDAFDSRVGRIVAFMPLALWWSAAWWSAASLRIAEWMAPGSFAKGHVFLALIALAAVLADRLGDRLVWRDLRRVSFSLPIALCVVLAWSLDDAAPWASGGWLIWPGTLMTAWWLLRRQGALDRAKTQAERTEHEGSQDVRNTYTNLGAGVHAVDWPAPGLAMLERLQHVLLVAISILLLGLFLRAGLLTLATWERPWTEAWWYFSQALPLAMALGLARLAWRIKLWPWPDWHGGYLRILVLPVGTLAILWTVLANLGSDGSIAPLPYWPLLNPLDLGQALLILSVAPWLSNSGGVWPALPERLRPMVWGVCAAAAFLWLNSAVLRAVHHLTDIPLTHASILGNPVMGSALSLLWISVAMLLMGWGVKRLQRSAWLVGAGLIAVVVLKLFMVDLGSSGTLARIVSFLGTGVALLIIGYFAPIPPRRISAGSEAVRVTDSL